MCWTKQLLIFGMFLTFGVNYYTELSQDIRRPASASDQFHCPWSTETFCCVLHENQCCSVLGGRKTLLSPISIWR